MEIVVVLAFAILVAVFIFSLIFCMMMKNVCCFGKHNVPETSPSLKFSTLQLLQQDNLDDIILFGPHIGIYYLYNFLVLEFDLNFVFLFSIRVRTLKTFL